MSRLLYRTLALSLLLGTSALAAGASSAPRPGETAPHDLANLRTLTRTILYVKDNYATPERIKPKEMAIAALEAVEKEVPDLIVDGNARTGELKVTLGDKTQSFDLSRVDSLWKMSFVLKDVFGFIKKNMRPIEDTRDIEYAAVNGMLSMLDSRSMLLRPELYREMKPSTQGELGSIGLVLQMKEGNLTVVKALRQTPAHHAGLQKDDVIREIGEESTVNMGLDEAISKLRGPVGSKVSITVDRKGWEQARPMSLERAKVIIESVQHKLLTGNVSYVRLKNFQGNTTRDLQAALAELRQQAQGGMKGVVLDLRGNPGGLLEQATQVADVFLSEGNIATFVGLGGKVRDEKRARATEGEDAFPIAVLVDSGSAAASEIVAGALKNLNRAVIIGRRTFGLGSVQVLYDFPDGGALKLTIAKYLTPGDVSIHGVGIVPDIELAPSRVTRERVGLVAPRKASSDAERESPPGSASPVREKPAEQVRYLTEDEGLGDEQLDAEQFDEVREDFEVLFARDFVLKAPAVERDKMLRLGKAHVEQKRREEEARLHTAMAALGIDWSPGSTPKTPRLAVTLTPGAEQKLMAGDVLNLEVTVENQGTEPVSRLRARMESPDHALLDGREFLFGAVKPGEKKSWTVPIPLPKGLSSRRDAVTVQLQDDSGLLPGGATAELNFVEQPRPAFAFNWQVLDRCAACNGDGLAQRSETVDVRVDITNTGTGKASDAFARLKNRSGPGIFILRGYTPLDALAPGETTTAHFELEVKPEYEPETFALTLAITSESLEEPSVEQLLLPVRPEAPRVEALKAVVRLEEKTVLFVAPEEDARPLARLMKGAVVRQVARVGGFAKVELDKDRFAFVKAEDAKAGRKLKPAPVTVKELEPAPAFRPLLISFNGVDLAQGGLVTSGERFTLSGTLTSLNRRPLDLTVRVNEQKVFVQVLAPSSDEPTPLAFATELKLKEGLNRVQVVASESADSVSIRTLHIRQRPEATGPTPHP